MIRIAFATSDGRQTVVDTDGGITIMELAVTNGIDGIEGECGGAMACGTCHIYVDLPSPARPSDAESDMLDFVDGERHCNSRLGCQVVLGPEHDGLVVHLPSQQG